MLEPGDRMYLAREIIEYACEDHPEFLLGREGEQVEVLAYEPAHKPYPYLVQGPTNPGKPWRASRTDLMFTKPMRQW